MTPYRCATIGFFRERAEWIAGLKGEVLLYGVDGREVVVLDFAKLQEATSSVSSAVRGACEERGLTFHKALGRDRPEGQ